MRKSSTTPKSVDDYIAGFPHDVQDCLKQIRMTIRRAAPAAEESISYRIPTFKLKGRPLIYFAAFKKHIGLYPITGPTREQFKTELSRYEGSKGTARFLYDRPVPYGLIARIAKFRAKEIVGKATPTSSKPR